MRSSSHLLSLCLQLLLHNTCTGALAPNALLGTCFDDDWVKTIEANLSISALERDDDGDRLNPFLQAALIQPRFWVSIVHLICTCVVLNTVNALECRQIDDPRTQRAISQLYQSNCGSSDAQFYGVGATLDSSGNVSDPGRVNGSLVIEWQAYTSPRLSTMVFSILAQELVGHAILVPLDRLPGSNRILSVKTT